MDKPFGECSGRIGRRWGKAAGGKSASEDKPKDNARRDNNRPKEKDAT